MPLQFVNLSKITACSQRIALLGAGVLWLVASTFAYAASPTDVRVSLGQRLFADAALSRDGKVSCQTCHDPAHAYASPQPKAVGVDGKTGTRNAPSLVGIASDTTFFWDGRRSHLKNAVVDPLTNPVELGLSSRDEVVRRLRADPAIVRAFHAAYSTDPISFAQVQDALASFVRSLTTGTSAFDRSQSGGLPLPAQARQGKALFAGIGGCSACHALTGSPPRFSDNQYHHSGIGPAPAKRLPALAQAVVHANLDASGLGPKVLANADWSALGRFAVSHNPADIGAFHTPSLRNVAVSAPYMHDGSIATLREAVDHEVYYRGFSTGHPVNLTDEERRALVSFLESLTDTAYAPHAVARKTAP